MNRLKRRTAILTATLAILLTAATVYDQKKPVALPAESTFVQEERADPLTSFRTERQQLRQKQRAELNDIIHDADTDAETLSMAQRQLMALMESESAELTLEGLLSARDFVEPLVSVSGGAVYAMVRAQQLTRQQTAVILDLILRETGVTAGNVKILAIN